MLNLSATIASPSTSVKVKEERLDEAEIREMAARMKEQHKVDSAKAAAQQRQQQQTLAARNSATAAGQTNMLNYLTRKPTATVSPSVNGQDGKTKSENGDTNSAGEKKACDEESQRGHFGWATFGKIHIPYILRQAEKYCAVRMVEMKLLNKYLSYLHQDIYSCTCVRSYYITEAECRLLNEINHKHCDSQFGREMFTMKDLVVRLTDANKFYQFLDVCYKKLLMGSSGPSDKCGFIRINKESVVPYTVRDVQKFVPLFYFEGETENLKLKADYLSGWDLSYLKFCCKVQGIRNELFASDSVAVISLTDIKSYFPNGTEFEDYWPSKVVDTQLLIGTTATKGANSSVHWTRQPTQPPAAKTNIITATVTKTNTVAQGRKQNVYSGASGVATHNNTPQRMQTAANLNNHTNIATAAALGWPPLGTGPNMLTAAQTEHVLRMAQQQAVQQQQHVQQRNTYSNQRAQMPAQMLNRQQYPNYTNSAINLATMNTQQVQQPPPLVRSGAQQQAQISSMATALQRQQAQQYQTQQRQHLQNVNQMHQRAQPIELTGMHLIPEPQLNGSHPPYKIHKIPVQDKVVACINSKGYSNNEFLMTLYDFIDYFCPNTSLENLKQVLQVLRINLYIGNRHQCAVLKEAGKSNAEHMPLVQVRDIVQFMPQLNYMLRAQHQEQPMSKRARVS